MAPGTDQLHQLLHLSANSLPGFGSLLSLTDSCILILPLSLFFWGCFTSPFSAAELWFDDYKPVVRAGWEVEKAGR